VAPGSGSTGGTGSTGTTGTTTGGSSGTSGISENGAETCVGTAPALQLGQPVSGDTQGFANDYQADGASTDTCFPGLATAQGPDMVYRFVPPSTGSYTFTATPDPNYDVVLVVFDGSCQNPIVSCTLGRDVGGKGAPESATANLSAGSTYFVVVDGYTNAQDATSNNYGQFTLVVNTAAACSDTPLTQLSGPGTSQTVTGTTATAISTYSGTCGTAGFPDPSVAYTFTTTATTDLFATVSSTDGSFTPLLSIGTGCSSSYTEQTCNALGGTASSLSLTSLPAGTYTMQVAGYGVFGGSSGPYSLTVQLAANTPPPANEVCSGATPISLSGRPDGGLGTSLSVSNLGASINKPSSAGGHCTGNGHGPSVVYSVQLSSPEPSLTATLLPGDGGLDLPLVSIQASPCYENYDGGVVTNELACGFWADDGGAVAHTTSLRSGTYYLWVNESSQGIPGTGTLEVTVP
jgi:hypothetical protein